MTGPRMHPVRSSVLRSYGYAPLAPSFRERARDIGADGFIFVRLRSGGTYAYLAPSVNAGVATVSPSAAAEAEDEEDLEPGPFDKLPDEEV